MIKFGQLPFAFKKPSLDRKAIIIGVSAIAALSLGILSIKLYVDLQASQANLTRLSVQANDLSKENSSLRNNLATEKENHQKELLTNQEASENKVGAFAKQALACDEIKKKLEL